MTRTVPSTVRVTPLWQSRRKPELKMLADTLVLPLELLRCRRCHRSAARRFETVWPSRKHGASSARRDNALDTRHLGEHAIVRSAGLCSRHADLPAAIAG
ncbi:hypothetical protein [Nocardia colli]|uniref:hypothetical protein n=1 Tax=Nocardia colli TaxID=2545717 RepID=UPI00168CFA43|nr:hypothetical protein [Nocardia colli]